MRFIYIVIFFEMKNKKIKKKLKEKKKIYIYNF